MTENFEALNRATLVKRLAMLGIQHAAAYDDLNATSNRANQEILKQQIAKIEKDIEEADTKLKKIDAKSSDSNHRDRNFEDNMPQIDFSEVRNIINGFIAQSDPDGMAALFLIQNSEALGGQWCLKIVSDNLRNAGIDYKSYPIGLTKNDPLNETTILGQLAGQLGITLSGNNLDNDLSEIVKGICRAIGNRSTVFIEVKNCDFLCINAQVFNWFVTEFWAQLARSFRVHDKRRKAKLVVMLVTDGSVPPSLLHPHCYDETDPIPEKLRLLPLRNWHRNEVEDFLDTNLFQWENGLTVSEMTDLIYGGSLGGQPSLIHKALCKHFFKL